MRRKYIILSLLLSMVLAGGVLGCGGTASTGTASTSSVTGSSAQTAASAAPSTSVTAADITYDDDDKNEAWSKEDATIITLSDTSTELEGSGASESGGDYYY